MRNNMFHLILTAGLGSCLEVFDFVTFAFLSSFLSTLFFPSGNLLYTVTIFSCSYFFRPVGGLIIGHLADKYGRKKLYLLTLALMALPSLAIALLPTYAQIGLLAPCLLFFFRSFQGVALGGEVPTSIAILAESTSPRWRTLAICSLTVGANIGVFLSATVAFGLVHQMNPIHFLSYGWRIPFLIGASLGLIAFYFRKKFGENQQFLALKEKDQIEKQPLLSVLEFDNRHLMVCISLALLVSATTTTFHLFLPNYLQKIFALPMDYSLFVGAFGGLVLALSSLILASFSNKVPRQNYLLTGAFLITFICFLCILTSYTLNTWTKVYGFVLVVSIALAFINCIFMVILSESYQTSRRCSGISLSYNVAYGIGGGIIPIFNTFLTIKLNYHNGSFWLIGGLSLIILILVYLISRKSPGFFQKYSGKTLGN